MSVSSFILVIPVTAPYLMKKAYFLFLLCVFAVGVRAQTVPAGFDLANYGVHIEPDKRVLVVLAAIDAARTQTAGPSTRVINTRLSPAGSAFRTRLDSELSVPDDLRQKISTFLMLYKK